MVMMISFLFGSILPQQGATNAKDDGQDTAQEDEIEQHARTSEYVISTDVSRTPPGLVPILLNIIMSAEMALSIPMRDIVVGTGLIASWTGTWCVVRAATRSRSRSSFMLMRALRSKIRAFLTVLSPPAITVKRRRGPFELGASSAQAGCGA
jgi:hypothetical protein